MLPSDLSSHRARKQREAVRRMERDFGRVAPRLSPKARYVLRAACDAARDGQTSIDDVHALIRQTISDLDRDQRCAA